MGERHSSPEYDKLRKENDDLQEALQSRTEKLDAMVTRVSELEMQVTFQPAAVEQATSAVQCTPPPPPPSRTETAAQWTTGDALTPPRPLGFSEACVQCTPGLAQRTAEGDAGKEDGTDTEEESEEDRDVMDTDTSVEFSQSVLEPEPVPKMTYAELMRGQRARRAVPATAEEPDLAQRLGQCASKARQWRTHFHAQQQLVEALAAELEEAHRQATAGLANPADRQLIADLQARLQEAQQQAAGQQERGAAAAAAAELGAAREALARREAEFQGEAASLAADHLVEAAELLWEAQGGCLRATTAQLAAAVAAAGEQAEALGRERRQSETEHSEAAHLEEELRGRTAQLGDVSAALQDLQRRWLTAEEDAAREAVEREALAGLADILALRAEAIVAESNTLSRTWAEERTALQAEHETQGRRIAELESSTAALETGRAALEAQLAERAAAAEALQAALAEQERAAAEREAAAQAVRDQLLTLTEVLAVQKAATERAEEAAQAKAVEAAAERQRLEQRAAEVEAQAAAAERRAEEAAVAETFLKTRVAALEEDVAALRSQQQERAEEEQRRQQQHEARVAELEKEVEGHQQCRASAEKALAELQTSVTAPRAADSAAFARPTMLANRTNLAPEAAKRSPAEDERLGSPPVKRLKSQSQPLPGGRPAPALPQARPRPVIALSGFRNTNDPALAMYSMESRKEVQRRVAELGGALSRATTDELDPGVTHVITAPSSRTIKCLAAALTGRWVVSVHWVHESHAAGHWVDETPFGYRSPESVMKDQKVFLSEQFAATSQKIPDRLAHCRALVEQHGGGKLVSALDTADLVFVVPKEERGPFAPRRTLTWEQFIEFIYPHPPPTMAPPQSPERPRP